MKQFIRKPFVVVCLSLFGCLVIALLVAGCASIIHGTTQDIGISSTPSEGLVTIDNVSHGKTPVIANLLRKDNHIVKIELAGYQPFEATITRKVSGWVWGNVLFGGLIGLAVDSISGGLYNLNPEQIAAVLSEKKVGFLKKDMVYIAVVLNPDPKWKKIARLQPSN